MMHDKIVKILVAALAALIPTTAIAQDSDLGTTSKSAAETTTASADASATDTSATGESAATDTSATGESAATDTSATGESAATDTSATGESAATDTSATGESAATDTSAATDASATASSGTTERVAIKLGEESKEGEEAPKQLMPDADDMTQKTLNKTLHEVTTRVDTLKEDTFTTKSRLLLLREEVLQRSVSGARLLVRHVDDMGGQYELVEVHYMLDNTPAFSRTTDGDAIDIDDEVIYDGLLAPGTHQLSVRYVYKGKKWGVFTYMKGYQFVVESGYSFVVDEGKSAELIVTAEETGNFFTPYEERPSVSYSFDQVELAADALQSKDQDKDKKAKEESGKK